MNLPPPSDNLVNSLRGVGYILETALADLIDNSIFANAKNIEVHFNFKGNESSIEIIDDGDGMAKSELINAMTFANSNPNDKRDAKDLGRFGLGLKTASFSQARTFTVTTWKNKKVEYMSWDLEKMGKNWKCLTKNDGLKVPLEAKKHIAKSDSGTHILWENLDSLNAEFGKIELDSEPDFLRAAKFSVEHMKLAFHRFLDQKFGKNINISVNGKKLELVDPYLRKNNATQELPEEIIRFRNVKIKISPFIIAHKTKCSSSEYNSVNSGKGLYDNQGFYVYRNNRLIFSKGWFRIMPKTESTKYVRVAIDIPNSVDQEWEIDILKKEASPPKIIRDRLKEIIETITEKGRRVYRNRGQRLSEKTTKSFWVREVHNRAVVYKINEENDMISSFMKKYGKEASELFFHIAHNFPYEAAYHDVATDSINQNRSSESDEVMAEAIKYFLKNKFTKEEILNIEGFQDKGELIDELINT
jgi:hypothetical protein